MPVLRARIGGAWVDVGGGADEVFVGPADPIATAPGTELWYDTDEPAVLPDDLRWNAAWGTIGYATVTVAQTGITAAVNLTGLTVTFTPVAGRRYRVSAEVMVLSTVTGDIAALAIADAASTQLQSSQVVLNNGFVLKQTAAVVLTPPAGVPYTTKLTLGRAAGGTGTLQMYAATAIPAHILVEDIGPVAGAVPILGVTTRWDTAWGVIGVATSTAPYTTTGTHTTAQADGLSVTVAETAGRRLKISYGSGLYVPGGTNGVLSQLYRDAVQVDFGGIPIEAASASATLAIARVFTTTSATSGNVTYSTRVLAANNNTSVATWASAAAPRYLIVEDVGPVGGATPVAAPYVPWINVTFQNSWVNFGGSTQATQYRMIGDIVYVRGFIKSGTSATTVFTLPAGYRPPALVRSAISGALGTGAGLPYASVAADGQVSVGDMASTANVALNFDFSVTP